MSVREVHDPAWSYTPVGSERRRSSVAGLVGIKPASPQPAILSSAIWSTARLAVNILEESIQAVHARKNRTQTKLDGLIVGNVFAVKDATIGKSILQAKSQAIDVDLKKTFVFAGGDPAMTIKQRAGISH